MRKTKLLPVGQLLATNGARIRQCQALAVGVWMVASQAFAQTELQAIDVTVQRTAADKYAMPHTVETTTAEKMAETVNLVDTPDALKYMPSLMVRKRDSADFGGATLATRIWGVSYSAKSIVQVDGMPISSQLYNDNNYGPPKWFVVSPEEIERMDVLYGPFSAAYSGNSMGAVVDITTKRPTQEFEGTLNVTDAMQTFSQFGTKDTYNTVQGSALLGGKKEDLSWRLLLSHQDANTQPRAFATGSTAGTTTPYPYTTKTGTNGGYYYGASTLLHGVSDNINLKIALDVSRATRLSFSSGYWSGTTDSAVQPYTANYVTPANTTFASGVYGYKQEQLINGVNLKSRPHAQWDYDLNVSHVFFLNDLQRSASKLNADGSSINNAAGAGSVRNMGGSGWTNVDAKAHFRPSGDWSAHAWSFGYHQDTTKLFNQTTTPNNWQVDTSGTTSAATGGVTETKAWWMQDVYKVHPDVQWIVGGRYEQWSAHDGVLYANATTGNPTNQSYSHFSPKLSALWGLKDGSTVSASLANAMRFPTPGELFNIAACTSTTGCAATTYAMPATSLIKPENVNALELAYATQMNGSKYRASFFAEHTRNALISQYGALDATANHLYSYWMNVNMVRSYGVELSNDTHHFLSNNLDLFSSLTWVDSTIAANDGLTSTGKSVVGNKTPGVSPLRLKFIATYRLDEKRSIALGGNYQRTFYSSIDNNDTNVNTYLGFSGYTVWDVKARYKVDKNWIASAGVDNLANKQYFMYHPFPQRTWVANLKYNF